MTEIPESAKAEMDREIAHAKDVYSTHRIVKESLGRWLCKAESGTTTYWYEVIVLAGGRLFVHGDTDPFIFAQYSPHKELSEEINAFNCVYWMAHCARPDDRYFIEKAVIGTGEATVLKSDDSVLRAQIEEMILMEEKAEDNEEEDPKREERVEQFKEALSMVGNSYCHEEIERILYDALEGDAEGLPDGKRISIGMVFAHAALQRLAKILRERGGRQ